MFFFSYQTPLSPRPADIEKPDILPPNVQTPDVFLPPVDETDDLELDCANRPDGAYSEALDACTPNFWKCLDKRALHYKCPVGLFFNKKSSQCDFRENIRECDEKDPNAVEDVFGYGNDAPLLPVTTTKEPLTNVNCTGSPDGFYIQKACQPEYIQCLNGNFLFALLS